MPGRREDDHGMAMRSTDMTNEALFHAAPEAPSASEVIPSLLIL